MSVRRFKPRRRLRNEALPISVSVLLPLAMAWMFPYGALSPTGGPDSPLGGPIEPHCAFVELTESEEAEAMVAARTAWHVNSRGVKSLRLEMFADDLPADDTEPVVEFHSRTRVKRDKAIGYIPVELPTDLRAPAPAKLEKPDPPRKKPPFAREELLKLD